MTKNEILKQLEYIRFQRFHAKTRTEHELLIKQADELITKLLELDHD